MEGSVLVKLPLQVVAVLAVLAVVAGLPTIC
jgi:hypothetical protein